MCYATSSPSFYWQIFIFACFSVLQIVGIVLAVQTRKVKVPSLRDSKFVAAIIYISSILIFALAMETFALRNYINIGAGIITAGIFSLTTVFLALIFIPKVSFKLSIYNNNYQTQIRYTIIIIRIIIVSVLNSKMISPILIIGGGTH